MTREDWFAGVEGALDEWQAWRERGPSRAPSPDFDAGVRAWPKGLCVASFEAAVAAAQRDAHGPTWLSARLNDLELLWAEPGDDERCYLADGPDERGECRVFRFDPRRNCIAERGWPSIRAWLSSLEDDTPAGSVDTRIVARARSRAWLASALLGIGYATVAEDVEGAAAVADFEPNPRSVGDALYWLWHHAIAGNADALAGLLERLPSSACGADVRVSSSIAWLDAHARAGQWQGSFAGLGRERVASLREALDAKCVLGPRVSLSAPEPQPAASGVLEELDAWLRDHATRQREALELLSGPRREALLACHRQQPAATTKLLRKRIASKKLAAALGELIDALEREG